MRIHPSRLKGRLHAVWERLAPEERRWLCTLAELPPDASLQPAAELSEARWERLLQAMRRVVSLAAECRLALGYGRDRGARESGDAR